MPVKKGKNGKAVEQRDIKRRLIEISIRVDAYIYKNKPITKEEAENFKNEISVHQSRCGKDKHILQVTEKLLRCLKTIIEDTIQIIPSPKNISTPEKYKCLDSILEYPSSSKGISNKHQTNDVTINNFNHNSINEAVRENETQNLSVLDTIVISDSENETTTSNINEAKLSNDKGHGSMEGCVNLNEKNNQLKTVNITTLDEELLSLDVNTAQTSLIYNTNDKNSEYSIIDLKKIVHKQNEVVNDNSIGSEIKRKYKKKITTNLANIEQVPLPPINSKNKNYKKKKISGVSQDSDTNPQIKDLKQNKNRSKNDLQNVTRRRRKSTSKNNNTKSSNTENFPSINPPFCALNKLYKPVDVITNEVALPLPTVNDNEVRSILSNHDYVTQQMGELTIYNEHVVNDLSWIEGIRHVREVGTDEFDHTFDMCDESFWDNFVLPNVCSNVDFIV